MRHIVVNEQGVARDLGAAPSKDAGLIGYKFDSRLGDEGYLYVPADTEPEPGDWAAVSRLLDSRGIDVMGLSDGGLLSMYRAIADALAADDTQAAGSSRTYGVREFGDWRRWAEVLEREIRRRGLEYTPIAW